MKEVWMKTEPVDVKSSAYFDIKCEDGIGTDKTEPTEENVAVQFTKNENKNYGTSLKRHKCVECGKRFAQSKHFEQHKRMHSGERPFGCDICGKTYVAKSYLARHMQNHTTGEGFYGCDVCGKTLTTKQSLVGHMYIHSGYKPHACDICGTGFIQLSMLKTHKRSHTGENPFSCGDCGKIFAWNCNLQRHKRMQHTGNQPKSAETIVHSTGNDQRDIRCEDGTRAVKTEPTTAEAVSIKPENTLNDECTPQDIAVQLTMNDKQNSTTRIDRFYCVECGKRFQSKEHFERHQRMHTGERPFACDFCEKRCSTKSDLKVHMFRHTGKPHTCDICGTGFIKLSLLTAHKLLHTGEKPFSCEDCGKKFALKHNLKRHKRVHTRGERQRKTKKYHCVEFGQRFAQNDHFEAHQRQHTGERPFGCDICGKTYVAKSYLASHMQIHTIGDNPHACDICGTRFRRLCNLKTHQQVHTGKKRPSPQISEKYHCVECGQRFAQSQHFEQHKRMCTGERAFGCDICGKTLTTKQSLVGHMYIHSGYKPHAYGTRFTHRISLKTHKRSHTGEKPFSCEDCGKKFALNRFLQLHKRKRHTGNQSEPAEAIAQSMDNDQRDIRCEDGAITVKTEPTTEIMVLTAEEVCSEAVTIKSEITLNEYECTPQDIAVQLTMNGERRFGCDICAKTYHRQCAVARHKRYCHAGDK